MSGRLALAFLGIFAVASAFAAQYSRSGTSDSFGAVLERRSGTSGTVAVPVDENSPVPVAMSPGTFLNASMALSTTSQQVIAATARVRVKVVNTSGVGNAGGTAIVEWCRWGSAAVSGGVGSFPIQPNGGGIDDQGPGVNQTALNCLSESGTPSIYVEQY